ncbi:MAG: sigma-70 family RNA polymerase sigma factor [Planctomycetes bacterium]|nr:sigma-70 family RNA polymerase sigma factor [Planctomycetota bacterium]
MTSTCILHQIAEGRASAMNAFLERYSGLVWSLARRHSPTPQDAEDAVQEIFMEVWRSAGRYDPNVAAEQTFIAMIARRRLIDRARRVQRAPRSEALPEPEVVVAAAEPDRVEIRDEAARISKVMKTLRPEQQKVLELSLVHGRSHSQISEQTGMPLGTVKSLARRGLMKVRRALGVEQPETSSGEVTS